MQHTRFKINELQVECLIPEKWDELSTKQLLYVARNYEAWRKLAADNQSLLKARALLLIELCGLKTRSEVKKLCTILSFIDEDTDINVLDLTNFVMEKHVKLTKNIFPKIKVGLFTWYHGPADRLSNLTIREFAFAFSAYMAFNRDRTDNSLDSLVAILYRPFNENWSKDGNKAVPFNNQLVEEYKKRMRRVKYEQKYAVYLYFTGCMEYFGSHKKFGTIFRRAEKNENAGTGNFIETARQLAGPKLGTIDQTLDTNLYLFLQELADVIQKNKPK